MWVGSRLDVGLASKWVGGCVYSGVRDGLKGLGRIDLASGGLRGWLRAGLG